ncbi:uncharacterized protein PFL1_05582 [Pseudozyma flocculosa PF-1]|uniref:Uncharacterized protein n=2 Tax=Pseudozyma flocculosa TaxID=84751 RepID=A0A5C3F9L2_9BASI|nr:uncharacterized protein PFL1_05582 [Pseudozyma flocculosa PF-1]EPQ26948.1 hypothetical protein PFL1_05582 [Pseudozyma flocculosa PF-1]SPO41143.1 uncharacterized protein PSFLO_06625 [Pseudozyma flocculosa]
MPWRTLGALLFVVSTLVLCHVVRAPAVEPEALESSFWNALAEGGPLAEGLEALTRNDRYPHHDAAHAFDPAPLDEQGLYHHHHFDSALTNQPAPVPPPAPERAQTPPHSPESLDSSTTSSSSGSSGRAIPFRKTRALTPEQLLVSAPLADLFDLAQLRVSTTITSPIPWLYSYDHPSAFVIAPGVANLERKQLWLNGVGRPRDLFAATDEERHLVMLKYVADLRSYYQGSPASRQHPHWVDTDALQPPFEHEVQYERSRKLSSGGFGPRGPVTAYLVNGDMLVTFRSLRKAPEYSQWLTGSGSLFHVVAVHYPPDVRMPAVEVGVLATPYGANLQSVHHPAIHADLGDIVLRSHPTLVAPHAQAAASARSVMTLSDSP